MGTGIVSIALLLDGRKVLSDVLLVLDATFWLALVVLLPARARRDWARFRVDVRHPTALTSIAGTSVLGARLTLAGWDWAGGALLALAAAIWLCLVPHVLRHWRLPTIGASFILTVSTESLGLLAATLALKERSSWLLYAALVLLGLGLAFYLYVLRDFDWRQLAVGIGDHWVTGGALAISTVTAGRLALAAGATHDLGGLHGPMEVIALILWCLTLVWLPALLLSEALRPRLSYNVRRWSTVFPVGMYAACSFIVGAVTGIGGITEFARVWVWVALAVWILVCVAMLRRAPQLAAASASASR